MAALLQLQGIQKSYPMRGGDVHALKGIDLEFDEGEFVSIVGTSGSGKSTLLYLLGLLTEPTAGSFRLRGKETGSLTDVERSQLRGQEIGFVFQSFHLVPQLDILQNVRLAARYAPSHGDTEIGRIARDLIDRVGLSHRLRHRPIELSNGEMQRVAVARALLNEPKLILADEPTGNLDEENGNEIFGLLKSLQDDGKTVVMVTHDLQIAARTPRTVRLKDGEVLNGAA